MADNKFLKILRMRIAELGIKKKSLALTHGVPPADFSKMLYGDMRMPFDFQEALIKDLELGGFFKESN